MARPICTACKHCHPDTIAGPTYNLCYAPKGRNISETLAGVVKGPAKYKFCFIQRQDNWFGSLLMNTCGLRGRWFEPKETV